MMNSRSPEFKLVVIGDSFIGKTTLLRKYVGKGDLGRRPFVTKQIERDGENITLHIHDTMGQERYRSLTSSYYRGSHGCLLCFDVMNTSTFDDLKYWIDDINDCLPTYIPKLLIGIHRSSSPQHRQNRNQGHSTEISQKIPEKHIDLFRDLHKLAYMEVDLNDVSKIMLAFETLVDLVIEDRHRRKNENATDIDIIHIPRTRENRKESECLC